MSIYRVGYKNKNKQKNELTIVVFLVIGGVPPIVCCGRQGEVIVLLWDARGAGDDGKRLVLLIAGINEINYNSR